MFTTPATRRRPGGVVVTTSLSASAKEEPQTMKSHLPISPSSTTPFGSVHGLRGITSPRQDRPYPFSPQMTPRDFSR
jgi:hypothetical protein